MTDRSRRKNGGPAEPCGNPPTGAATTATSARPAGNRAAQVRPTDCPDCWGTGVDVYRELCGTCGGRLPEDRSDPPTSRIPTKHSDTALALRLRRMVQP